MPGEGIFDRYEMGHEALSARLGEDWMTVFLVRLLPHLRQLRAGGNRDSIDAIGGLLDEFDLRREQLDEFEQRDGWEQLPDRMADMDAETDRLRSETFRKASAWRAAAAATPEFRAKVATILRFVADMQPAWLPACEAAVELLEDA